MISSNVYSALNPSVVETFYSVNINQQDLKKISTFLTTPEGEILVCKADLKEWNLHCPAVNPVIYHDESYYFLHAIKGLQYKVNEKEMSIEISAPPCAFAFNEIKARPDDFVQPTPPPFGGFLNYDLFAESGNQVGFSDRNVNGLFTVGVFNPWGTLTSDFLAKNCREKKFQLIRLNTVWEKDLPNKMQSIEIGDSYTTPGMWGRSVGFGGIEWGTNFATQPAFIKFPLPRVAGEAVLPTVAELYVNNALVSQKDVPPGPFAINAIPVINGRGIVSVVTTDILGRQQIVSMPYYASAELLKAGLHDYSYQIGFVRKEFGRKSNDYGRCIAVATHRLGISDCFTSECHVELSNVQALGIGGTWQLGNWAEFNSALAGSHRGKKFGVLATIGFQHINESFVSYGANLQYTSNKFTQLGCDDRFRFPTFSGQVFCGANLWDGASVGVTYIKQNFRYIVEQDQHDVFPEDDKPINNVDLISMSYSQSVAKNWYLNLSGQMNLGRNHHKAAYLTLTRGLGDQTSATLSTNIEPHCSSERIEVLRSLPIGPGWGYNLQAGIGQQKNYLATVSAQNRFGTYSVGAAQFDKSRGYQAQASGSIAFVDNHPYLARQLGDSFAVVKTPGYSNVRVYNQNQLEGRTDSNGNIFIPRMLPYQHNPIRIELDDLPMDAMITEDQMDLIPYYQSGLVANFAVRPSASATVKLVQANGEVVPSGAEVRIIGQTSEQPVTEGGEVYLTGLCEGANEVEVMWDEHVCRCIVNYKKTQDLIPDLGTVICGG